MPGGEVKIPLKLLVDRKKNKVLLAEAGSDFIDILFSFLTLPMGTIVRILKVQSDSQPTTVRSFRKLYESVEKLNVKHLRSEECKVILLNPRNVAEALCQQLKFNIDDTEPTKYFICQSLQCSFLSTYSTARCSCGKFMDRAINVKSDVNTDKGNCGVFVTGTASFIVSDDLHVFSNTPSFVYDTTLKRFGIKDFETVEEITVNIGSKEIVDLLNCSLQSNSPLTDVFLSKSVKVSVSNIVKSELGLSAEGKVQKSLENTISVKLVIQKSSIPI